MIPARSKWEPYWPLALGVGSKYGVAPSLVLAVMYIESTFNPNAYRDEPQIQDGSRGLMQVLLKTARGLGFTGDPTQLFDPTTNATLGAKLLGQNLDARGGDMAKALSMYNGGYRPALGFGERLASGKFGNQAYVDRGLAAEQEFRAALANVVPPVSTPDPDPFSTAGESGGGTLAWIAAGVAIAGAIWAALKGR